MPKSVLNLDHSYKRGATHLHGGGGAHAASIEGPSVAVLIRCLMGLHGGLLIDPTLSSLQNLRSIMCSIITHETNVALSIP